MKFEKFAKNQNKECLKDIKSTEFEDRLDQETIEKMSPPLKELLFCNEHTFSASQTLIDNIIALYKDLFNKREIQSLLFEDGECNALKGKFLMFLKKYRLYQRTYSNNNKDESLEILATDTFKTFNEFLYQIFPTIFRISQKCSWLQELPDLSEQQREQIFQNEMICSEIKKYANVLQYQFANIRGFDGLIELQKSKAEVNLLHKIVNAKFFTTSTPYNDVYTTESTIKIKENSTEENKLEKNYDEDLKLDFKNNENDSNITHLQQNISKTTTDEFIDFKRFDTFAPNTIQSHKDAFESSKGTVHISFKLVPVLAILIMIISVILVIYKSVHST
ncbi:hypothetical protein NBO_285g0001 [Nosema bombycis CQ1]|uniref:Uncharacterized protein n=1 Tax=Nosema bombycis (strain CQ1 / CVCC 102059) TaxID=578461 RepID=R0MFR9_NOSB1|nr:hypothetical protein NBO_285g0001 [Nosema bombycis CQ1]|eukprot:EOB12970.1 hypothetical protein NBO_285g0001 [Nosema bombycis CQ1]